MNEELSEMLEQAMPKINAYVKEHGEDNSRLAQEASMLTPTTPPQTINDSNDFPDEPISPTDLSNEVSEQLKSFGIVVPNKTPTMVEELCRSFNECIRLNKEGESQTLILSPKTGSAKSVSSKMYVSLLKKHASIIVVYTVKEAIDTCEDINAWSRDNNYARCTYRENKDNKNPLRVDKSELKKFRCIVISHSLFKVLNENMDIEDLSIYDGRKREFVLVDERIDLYSEVTFPLSNLKYLSRLFKDIKESLRLPLVDNEIKYLDTIQGSFNGIEELKESKFDIKNDEVVHLVDSKRFIYMDDRQRKESNIEGCDFNNFYKALNENTIKLEKVIDPLSLLGDNIDLKEIKKNLKAHLKKLSIILKDDFYYFAQANNGQGPIIMTTENILNSFGSSVVLDATATVNALYSDKISENPETIKLITTTNPRRYDNFIINKCRGVSQGKNSVYGSLSQSELDTVIDLYKKIAYSITGKEDNLLIIAHKDFKNLLEKKITKKNIEFTYWGNHRGKNDWSHCNKILVIGWNYLPTEVHCLNYINAINEVYNINNDNLREIKYNYSGTQIVDDLVQGVNRGAVRTTVSTDGDCAKSEVYIFYPNSTFGNDVIDGFEAEFEGADPVEWIPDGIDKIKKLAKSYDNIEKVVAYVERKVNELTEIKQSSVQSYFADETNAERLRLKEEKMARATVSNAIKHKEFTRLLQTKEIHRVKYDGKSYKFEKINKTSS